MGTLTLLLRLFLFLLISQIQNYICKSTPHGKYLKYAPGKVEGLPFHVELSNTTLQCAGKCLQNRKCKVANFHWETRQCHFFSVCYDETEDIDGWEILRVIDDQNTNFIGPPFTVHSVINYTGKDCRNPSSAVFTCPKITPGKSQDHCPISVFNNTMNTWSDYNLSCTIDDCAAANSTWYRGKVSCTITSRTCQYWNTNYPHDEKVDTHTLEDLNNNYCRDPDFSGKIWCYTTDPDVRWEFCHAPLC